MIGDEDTVLFFVIENVKDRLKAERLYNSYRYTMLGVALNILKDRQLAEDAVHEAFLRIIDNLGKINEDNCNKTRSFLAIVTRNVSLDIYNHRKNRLTNLYSLDDEEHTYMTYSVTTPLEILLEQEGINIILDAISQLNTNYSDVLMLRYYHGYTVEEISNILKISKDNVSVRISRAKGNLINVLGKEEIKIERA